MRLDKYLKVSRLIKRRTVANDACDGGKVWVNGRVAKPGLDVKEGDIIEVHYGANVSKYRIKTLSEHVLKADAAGMYEVLSEQE